MTGPTQIQAEGAVILPGDPAAVTLPSGQEVTLIDVVWNAPGPEGLAARFRFLAPAIAREGGTVGFEDASADMAYWSRSGAARMNASKRSRSAVGASLWARLSSTRA